MKWITTITDVQRVANSQLHFVLAAADCGDAFSASTLSTCDLNADPASHTFLIEPTPSGWVSMAQNCAGNALVLTGGAYAHHTWNHGVLVEHPGRVAWRSGHAWRAGADVAFYCGHNDEVTAVRSAATDSEQLGSGVKLSCIHGLHAEFRVAGGQDGVLFIDRGNGWIRVEDVPTLSHFVAIHCVSETEIYLCAGYGGIFRWNGQADWFHFEIDSENFMYSLCRYKGRMCAASLGLKSYWLTATDAVPIPQSTVAIRFTTDGDLLFGLGLGRFEVFDGTDWRIHELDLYKLFPKELEALYAAEPGP